MSYIYSITVAGLLPSVRDYRQFLPAFEAKSLGVISDQLVPRNLTAPVRATDGVFGGDRSRPSPASITRTPNLPRLGLPFRAMVRRSVRTPTNQCMGDLMEHYIADVGLSVGRNIVMG